MGWLQEPPVQTPLPTSLIKGINKPLAEGFTPIEYLKWGIESAKEIDKANCRLYEARKLNSLRGNIEFKEIKPEHCNSSPITE